jgi:aspartyl-tRNA synthetase
MQKFRTYNCGELTEKNKGEEIILSGWVNSRRDHGGLIFIDLRDRYGITQITFDPKISRKSWEIADKVRNEYVIRVEGRAVLRPSDMINPKLGTGKVEVEVEKVEVLAKSKTPPFEIDTQLGEEKEKKVNEELRLKYRFLDLRSKKLQKIIQDRDKVIAYIRDYFHKNDFTEIQTPILANSSPEGARDYLVPSRIHPGKFYALPQAPQQFKQLLMVAGFDKYFQIAPCFRDEDPRADRHAGDFYQIDMEMSFVDQEDIWDVIEPLMIELTEKFSDKKVVRKPFTRISYKEAMDRYGTDKPDLRFDFPIKNVSHIFTDTNFAVFSSVLGSGGVVHALKIDGGARFSRKEIDELTEIAKQNGVNGLAYIQIEDSGPKSPILKFFSSKEKDEIVKETEARAGDIIFFGASEWKNVCKSLGAVRDECGKRLNLKDSKKAAWAWIYDYPLYEMEDGKIDFSHNPFSMPQGGLEDLKNKNPLEILAYQYDIVCNGYEISSGAIRNHRPDIMYKAFEIAGYSREQVDKKFGHMIRAFEYGAPPHGGCALGLDRILMVLWECSSIRDIYAFPKNSNAQDVMLDSPSEVSKDQLDDLHIRIKKD